MDFINLSNEIKTQRHLNKILDDGFEEENCYKYLCYIIESSIMQRESVNLIKS